MPSAHAQFRNGDNVVTTSFGSLRTVIHPERLAANVDGGFVVFLIGMRINRPWKVHKWWPVAHAIPSMLKETAAQPQAGMLGGNVVWSNHGHGAVLAHHGAAHAYAKDGQARRP